MIDSKADTKKAATIRAFHLASLLSDYHRFFMALSFEKTGIYPSTYGAAGCCVALEIIRDALGPPGEFDADEKKD